MSVSGNLKPRVSGLNPLVGIRHRLPHGAQGETDGSKGAVGSSRPFAEFILILEQRKEQFMFTPSPAQIAIIDHEQGHALVIAGPGSGKTTTLVAHVKKLILERGISSNDVWVMAFNKDIALKLGEAS